MALLLMLLISGCTSAWELLPTPSFSSLASSSTSVGVGQRSGAYEFTNATGAFVHCDGYSRQQHQDRSEEEPVARPSGPIWLDASGQPVSSIPGLRQVLSNGTMVLLPFRGDAYRPDVHSTEYRCLVPAELNGIAGNSQSFVLSPPIVVRSVVLGALQVYASDAYALAGNSAVLTCLLLPSNQAWAVEVTHWTVSSSSAAAAAASAGGHLVDSHQAAQGGSKYAVIDGHLHVADVTVEDTRMAYRCHARHRLAAAGRAVSSPPARIVMRGIVDDQTHPFQQPLDDLPDGGTAPLPPAGPPRLVAPGRRVVHVKLGQDAAYLTCRIVAHPPAKIRWFKVSPVNGAAVALTNDGAVRRIAVSGDWLQLRHVSAEDAGRYRCQASNAHGQVEAEFVLDVVGRLGVNLEPRRQVAGVDEPVEWTCNVSGLLNGQSPPLVRWTRNGADVPSDSSRFYFPQPNVLRINQAAASDAGVYQCLARMPPTSTSPAGAGDEVQARAELVVRDLPARLTGVFSEQTVHPGRPVYMHCFATGNPAPSVVWSVDSLPFTYTSGRASVSRQVDDSVHRSYLNITSADVEDGGLYCCALQSREPPALDIKSPNQQHCARLNVYGPVSVRWASNRTAVAGQDYSLHCPYSGYPVLSVSWYRYSQAIKDSDKYKISANGTLRISNADPVSDSGEYTCIVKGTSSSTAKRALYLDVIRPPVIEPFSFPVQVQDGGRAQVTCAISAGDLPIEVAWLRDGRPIANYLNVEVQTGEFHSLLIFKKLRGEHSGVYTCTARNLAATASRAATLLVQVPPKWMVEPQDVFPLENHPAKIPCRVHAVPVPSILWYRVDGQNHQMVHPTNNIVMHGDGSIQFNRITKGDEGFLQCRATNNIGQPLSKTIRISVNAGARVRIQSSGSILPTGSEALLRCEVSGDPPLTVHWKRFDQLISSIDRYQLSMTSPSAVNKNRMLDLNISRIEADDSGNYICQAANAYGSDAAEIQLVVQELPKAPGKLQLTSAQSRSAEVQWHDDHADPLLQYRVQLVRPGTGWTFNYTVEAGRNLVTLPHLHPFTSYQVFVYAINSAGVGPPSAPLEFQTLEEAPSGSPRHVLAEAKSSRSLLVSWLPPQEDSWNGRLVTFTVTCLETGTSRITQRSLAFARESSRPVRRVQILVDDLRPATVYAVAVRAWNRMGSGPESESVSLGTPEAAPAAAPVNVQCSAQSADAIHVSWSHPGAGELHGHLLGFRIVYKMQASSSWPNEALLAASKRVGNTLESVLYGLQAFQNYSVQVSAVNRAGSGPLSVPVVCQTEETAPNVVQEIKAASVSGSSILVAWRRPVPSNGRISHYVVTVKDGKTGETRRFVHQANRNLTFHVGSLVEGRPYEVSVTAGSRTGESSPSKTVTVTPTSKSGVKILDFSRSVHVDEHQTDCVLACPATDANQIERFWTYNGQPLGANPALNYREGRDGSLHLSEVDRAAEGDYACTVRNPHGRDSVLYSVHLMRVPEAPQLSVTPTSTSSIRISWSKGQPSSRPPILELVVLYRPAGNPDSIAQEKIVDANEDGTVLEGLLCGTQYEVQMQARNAVGFGPKSGVIRAMTRGSGPTLPEAGNLFGTTNSLPGTLFVHLDHWPTGGCRIGYVQVERKGPVRLLSADGADAWNTLASNLNPDDQPMLRMSDFIADETYHLRLTAASDAGVQIAAYIVRRSANKNSQTGSHFDVQPMVMASSSASGSGYESLIVIASMSISGLMLAFSIGAIGYVFHKRKQYRAGTSSTTKSEYSLRTVAEQLDNNEPGALQVHGRPRINGAASAAGSTYSLRKQVDPPPADSDDGDDDDITPYATFTLKPICGMDTVRSLMSVPTLRAPDSHSSNSIEADVYGHQHPTLPCMTMLANGHLGAGASSGGGGSGGGGCGSVGIHPHSYRHLNRSPVPPYRCGTSDASAVYSDTYSSKNVTPGSPTTRWNNNKKHRSPNQRTPGEAARLPSHFSEFRYIGADACDANKFRF